MRIHVQDLHRWNAMKKISRIRNIELLIKSSQLSGKRALPREDAFFSNDTLRIHYTRLGQLVTRRGENKSAKEERFEEEYISISKKNKIPRNSSPVIDINHKVLFASVIIITSRGRKSIFNIQHRALTRYDTSRTAKSMPNERRLEADFLSHRLERTFVR